MDLWLNIVLIAGPLVLGVYLSTVQGITGRTAMVVWIMCLFICVSGGYRVIRKKKEEEKETKAKRYYRQLQERQVLYSRGLPIAYVNGLGKSPILKHSFNMGQKYEKESKFEEAI